VLVRILDRYVVREIVPPLLLALAGLTFVLMMPPIMQNAASLIAAGVRWPVVVRLLYTLTPQALSVTIPIAVLYGVLFGLGRLSADREFVALQACGVSVFRIARPIALLAVVGCLATGYETIYALPDANQTFREITFEVIASGAQSDIKARVFFQNFPNRVLYVREILPDTGWHDVFLADDTQPDQTTVYVAKQGRLVIDRSKKTVQLVLEDVTRHVTYPSRPEDYDVGHSDSLALNMNWETIFPRSQIIKGDNEKTIAELRETAAESRAHGGHDYPQLYTIQQKFALPAACFVLALIGVALGATSRKDGKLASFALGAGVVFAYYIVLYSSRAGALAGVIQASFAPWIANAALGAIGIGLVLWRAGSSDQPIRISLPSFARNRLTGASRSSGAVAVPPAARPPVVIVLKVPHIAWPRPRLLDLYVARQYVSVFVLAFFALVGIFYISTFIDLADRLFRGVATTGLLLRYFYFQTPQYVYFIIPLAGLIAALVTIGLLTKNSELIVMRACGISLYRSALPLLLFAALASGALFELEEHVLADSNREAQRLNAIIRNNPIPVFGVLNRQWILGKNGDIYRYQFFDPRTDQFNGLAMFAIDQADWRLSSVTRAQQVMLVREPGADGQPVPVWRARQGWSRQFSTATRRKVTRTVVTYTPFNDRALALEPPSYFKTESPEADRMTYGELKAYIAQLQASGYHAVPNIVWLHKKVAFPFVTIVMTFLAVPFAAALGRSGALYGIGVGLMLSIVYWISISIFSALGEGGWITPILAAWAPNILFGAAAAYLLLTVRT
jgi:LPS export ABC transporter permease LptG/LPS export ABC transporter permease LptF